MRDIRDLLSEHPFFSDLPGADLDLIAGCGSNVHFAPDEVIFEEGSHADRFYVLRRGRVSLTVHNPGHGDLVLATAADGEVLGWSWLFPPYRWHLDARAQVETSAIALDGACLRAKCDDDNALGYRLMQRFAHLAQRRLQETRLQLLDLYGRGDAGDAGDG